MRNLSRETVLGNEMLQEKEGIWQEKVSAIQTG